MGLSVIGKLEAGISIAEWEDNNAYEALAVWYRRCHASNCLYPHGRLRSGEGPWELLLCSSCAARGTHRRCSYLSDSRTEWECNACAGEGTASSTSSGLAGLGTTSQQGLQLSQTSVTPESSSSGTTSEHGLPPPQGSTAPESSSSTTTSQAPSEPANRSRVPESSGLSSHHRTECHGRCETTHNAAPIAESSTSYSAIQGTSRSSRRCRALEYIFSSRLREQARTRSRSPLRHQAPESPSQPQRHLGSRQTTSPGAQRCSYTAPAAPGSCVPESSGLSSHHRTESQGRWETSHNAAPIAASSTSDSAIQGTSRSSRRCRALEYIFQ
ncbi:mucin-12-like [Coturnix japonica]|uniref:mucin-12-like n=1 Tax=Coturnix japonica TaxID=93934 RepID=UPI0013A5C0E0|nr:mucin-12-like [Coturnix japonica]